MQIIEFNMTPRDSVIGSNDLFFVNKNYAVVIDTKQYEYKLTVGKKPLNIVMGELFIEFIKRENPCSNAKQFIDNFSKYIQSKYKEYNILETLKSDKDKRPYLTCAVFNKHLREVWLFGDCQCLVDNEHFTNRKFIDDVLFQVRRMYIESKILEGKTSEVIMSEEKELIKPLLGLKKTFLNRHNGSHDYYDFCYSAIDGFDYNYSDIVTIKVPYNTREIILATDGYPVLENSLVLTEEVLHEKNKRDPLGVSDFRTGTILSDFNVGYDDRTYLKVAI